MVTKLENENKDKKRLQATGSLAYSMLTTK